MTLHHTFEPIQELENQMNCFKCHNDLHHNFETCEHPDITISSL